MLTLLINWIIIAFSLILIAKLLPGIAIDSFTVALLAALAIVLVNLLVKPIVMLLTLPINLITLGLFSFVVNALMFALAAWLVPGFEVANFLYALLGSLLLSLITTLLGNVTKETPLFR